MVALITHYTETQHRNPVEEPIAPMRRWKARAGRVPPAARAKPHPQAGERGGFKSHRAEGLSAEIESETEALSDEARSREPLSLGSGVAIRLCLREVGPVKRLTSQQQTDLAARTKKGDRKARRQLITASLRLVVRIARNYEDLRLPLLDLVSEGNLGLLKAVARFDPTKGDSFATHSSWWIRQSIKRALATRPSQVSLPAPKLLAQAA